jgi:Tfp pilus assembly protein PilV
MFINNRGNSIIEVMVVLLILTVGIVGTYGILDSGQKLSTTTQNRIKAINIAREGMEAVENIRDTNWLKFSSDYENCWKVKDYDSTCIGNL